MSCYDCNQPVPVNNPCEYQNCGCLNPTTFKCTTYSGTALPNLPIADAEDGNSILSKLDAFVGTSKSDKGKVLVNSGDTHADFLVDKLEAGLNISINVTGTGDQKKIKIDAVEGGTPIDVNAKVSSNDTTSDYLYSKLTVGNFLSKTIVDPTDNEKLKFDVNVANLLSKDTGNMLALGTDGKLKTSFTSPDGSETKLVEGTGVKVTGTGKSSDPYVISTNSSIKVARDCFDGIWKDLPLAPTGSDNVLYVSGKPQYRIRFDGSIEFRGSATYTVSYGSYDSMSRKFTTTIGTIPTVCLSNLEQAGIQDLKYMNYIENSQGGEDLFVQQHGYIIRKQNIGIIVEFQSSFTVGSARTVVVSFDGVISHPTF